MRSSSRRIWIMQASALVDLRHRSFITCSIQGTHKTPPSICNVPLSSFLVRSNRTTLQAWVYRVFNHPNRPIKTRHSHSLCSDKFLCVSIIETRDLEKTRRNICSISVCLARIWEYSRVSIVRNHFIRNRDAQFLRNNGQNNMLLLSSNTGLDLRSMKGF